MLIKQIKVKSDSSARKVMESANEILRTIPADNVVDVIFRPFRHCDETAFYAAITVLEDTEKCEKNTSNEN